MEKGMELKGGESSNANIPQVQLFVTGYDNSLPEDDIKSAVIKHFSSCGKVTDVMILGKLRTGALHNSGSFVYICRQGAVEKAKKLNGGGCECDLFRGLRCPKRAEEAKMAEEAKNEEAKEPNEEVDEEESLGEGARMTVTGYDTSLPNDVIKSALIKHFSPCGEIIHASVPGDSQTKIALVYIRGEGAAEKAVKLNGGCECDVEESCFTPPKANMTTE
ncbi:unnamed protein product [Arabis nemorensis]|uniref:RRM domain-containing protein n=1 Tax=Arabis nemorensis TaxID=586526 RepID=A0A565CKZ3_9BRAS|nr:unnamed protein product [Arabis nemorensis]